MFDMEKDCFMDQGSKQPTVPSLVLLADDEPSLQKVVERRLRANGYLVILAGDGAEALRLAREKHPDVIVMDVMMPKMSGDNVARELQADARTSNIPIIFLTCLVKSQEAMESRYMVGRNMMLSKPLDSGTLLSMIKKVTGA